MERYRDGKIPIDKFESSEYSRGSHEVFPLIHKWLDIALHNGVKVLVLNLISYPLPIFTILAEKSVRELVTWGSCLMSVRSSSGVVNCSSLKKLSLSYVTLDEKMLQTLLNRCPLIVSFILEKCWGLEKIELQKIKSVFLKVLKIRHCGGIWEIDAPNLVSLEYTGNQIPKLTIARESKQLKHSKIILHYLDDGWFCKLRKFLSNSTTWSQVCIDYPMQ